MLHPQRIQSSAKLAIALTLSTAYLTAPLLLPTIAQARPKPTALVQAQAVSPVVPAGTLLPVNDSINGKETDKLLVGRNEYRTLTLTIATPIRDRYGNLAIPAGSQVIGQLRPAGNGAQFVARQLKIGNSLQTINASSDIIATTEVVKQGATTADIVKGTVAGAGTATIIAGTTGDRHINALEVLGGAAAGALAGWALPTAGVLGGGSQEMIAINPNPDLTLILRSDLVVDDLSAQGFRPATSTYNPRYRQSLPAPPTPQNSRNSAFKSY